MQTDHRSGGNRCPRERHRGGDDRDALGERAVRHPRQSADPSSELEKGLPRRALRSAFQLGDLLGRRGTLNHERIAARVAELSYQ